MYLLKITILKLLNFFQPQHCIICNQLVQRQGLCHNCFKHLVDAPHSCKLCGFNLEVEKHKDICLACLLNQIITKSFSYGYIYNDIIYQILSKYKFQDNPHLCKLIARLCLPSFKKCLEENQIDIVIPIPIHFTKMIFSRQFNHIALIVYELSKLCSFTYNPNILKKIKRSKSQISLSGNLRIKNIKGTIGVGKDFVRNKENFSNKNLLVFDDVVTSGATISECVKVLQKHGAKSVHIYAFSRVEGILTTFKKGNK